MSTGKIIGYIVAGILIFFGVLWLLSAFSAEAASPGGRLLVGGLLVLIGLGIIVAVRLREPKPEQQVTIRQQIDIGGDVEMEALKCTQLRRPARQERHQPGPGRRDGHLPLLQRHLPDRRRAQVVAWA